jgi:hypothetical protein
VSRLASGLKHLPHGKKALDAMDISLEALQDLRHDDAGGAKV